MLIKTIFLKIRKFIELPMTVRTCPKCGNEFSEDAINNWIRTGAWICECSKKNELDMGKAEAANYKHKKLITAKPCEICGRRSTLPHPHKPFSGPVGDLNKSASQDEIKKKNQSFTFNSQDYAKEMWENKDDWKIIKEKIYDKKTAKFSEKSIEDIVKDQLLVNSIKKNNLKKLYLYQEQVFNEIESGKNVVITAQTASGKTQAFLFPVMKKILHGIVDKYLEHGNSNPKISALFVYPTKALASDQKENITKFLEPCGLSIDKIDGSVKDQEYRKQVLSSKKPNILATNFDFISWHLARSDRNPISKLAANAFKNVDVMVVDETHVCKGFFGANIHWVLKRLQRFNKNLKFIASSATLDDPDDFCKKLFPVPMTHISGEGERGKITLQIVVPKHGVRHFMIGLTRRIAQDERQVLAFNKSRKDAELLAIDGSDKGVEIRVHKAGLPSSTRSAIEIAFREKKLLAISCTPTLELGVNIGSIDCVISSYTKLNQLIQRIGRAGRKGQDAYGWLVLDEYDAISSYYINNIDNYFDDQTKTQKINYHNPLVLENQILLMASDRPITEQEVEEYDAELYQTDEKKNSFSNVIKVLMKRGYLTKSNDTYYCSTPGWDKASSIGIRDIGNQVKIKEVVDGKEKYLGEVEIPMAYDWLHKGAIYFHNKMTFRSIKFEKHSKYSKALLERIYENNETLPIKTKSARNVEDYKIIESTYIPRRAGLDSYPNDIKIKYSKIFVTQQIHSYHLKKRGAKQLVMNVVEDPGEEGIHELKPPLFYDYTTFGIILDFNNKKESNELQEIFREPTSFVGEGAETLHAVGHLLVYAAKMIVSAESSDIDGVVDPVNNTIVLFDNSMNGGNGVSSLIFHNIERIFERAYEIVDQCKCEYSDGCPKCTKMDGCNKYNIGLEKETAKGFLGSFRNMRLKTVDLEK